MACCKICIYKLKGEWEMEGEVERVSVFACLMCLLFVSKFVCVHCLCAFLCLSVGIRSRGGTLISKYIPL